MLSLKDLKNLFEQELENPVFVHYRCISEHGLALIADICRVCHYEWKSLNFLCSIEELRRALTKLRT